MRVLLVALLLAPALPLAAPVATAEHPCRMDEDPACANDDHDPLCSRNVPRQLQDVLCRLP